MAHLSGCAFFMYKKPRNLYTFRNCINYHSSSLLTVHHINGNRIGLFSKFVM